MKTCACVTLPGLAAALCFGFHPLLACQLGKVVRRRSVFYRADVAVQRRPKHYSGRQLADSVLSASNRSRRSVWAGFTNGILSVSR